MSPLLPAHNQSDIDLGKSASGARDAASQAPADGANFSATLQQQAQNQTSPGSPDGPERQQHRAAPGKLGETERQEEEKLLAENFLTAENLLMTEEFRGADAVPGRNPAAAAVATQVDASAQAIAAVPGVGGSTESVSAPLDESAGFVAGPVAATLQDAAAEPLLGPAPAGVNAHGEAGDVGAAGQRNSSLVGAAGTGSASLASGAPSLARPAGEIVDSGQTSISTQVGAGNLVDGVRIRPPERPAAAKVEFANASSGAATTLENSLRGVERSLLARQGSSGVTAEKIDFDTRMPPLSRDRPETPAYFPVTSSNPISPSHGAAEARMHMPVNMTFGQVGWADMIAQRSAMMAAQSIKFAELQLDPPELGPLQVKVSVAQEQASVAFVAANPQVREALDQTLVRLRELLGEQGLNLVDVDVSDQSSADSEQPQGDENTASAQAPKDEDSEPSAAAIDAHYGIDHYA